MAFKYRARSSSGEIVENTIEAADQQQAVLKLKSMGMLVISLTDNSAPKKSSSGLFSRNRQQTPMPQQQLKAPAQPDPLAAVLTPPPPPPPMPKPKMDLSSFLSMDLGSIFNTGHIPLKTLMVFFRQLATMESAGLSLTSALDMIASGEKNYALKHALIDIKNRIDRGIPLSQAMSAHRAFSPLIIALMQAGEEGGLLGPALDQGATLLEKQHALRGKIRSAMFYPMFIVFFAVAVLIFFFIFLVPKFEETFASLSIELPQITLTMFAIGDWFMEHWQIIAGGTFLFVFGWIFLSKNKATKGIMDRLKLHIPVMKDLLLKAAMARSSRTLSALTGAGVPIVRSIEMAKGTADNVPVENGYEELRKAVVRGLSLGDASKAAKIFPILVCQMMRIGEETGHLDQMLERVATWYDQELDEQIKASVSLMEPMLIVFVGSIIAIIAISIFAPITSAIVQLA